MLKERCEYIGFVLLAGLGIGKLWGVSIRVASSFTYKSRNELHNTCNAYMGSFGVSKILCHYQLNDLPTGVTRCSTLSKTQQQLSIHLCPSHPHSYLPAPLFPSIHPSNPYQARAMLYDPKISF